MTSELQRSRIGVRLMSSLLALDLAKSFINPALWILGESTSVISTVAKLATWADALGVVFIVSALMVAPYIVMQITMPDCPYRLFLTRCACNGLILGGVLWAYMAYLSRNLDYDTATIVFLTNSLFPIAMAGLLAYSINAEQIEAGR